MSDVSNKNGVSFARFTNGLAYISELDIASERSKASELETKRSRVCFHQTNDDMIHEMVITFHKDTYIRPHKHKSKNESYLVIDGEIDLIFFDEFGNVNDRVLMGDFHSGIFFYLKSISEEWHTVVVKSEFATILEITNGPFVANDCLFAEWAPETFDKQGIDNFLKSLLKQK